MRDFPEQVQEDELLFSSHDVNPERPPQHVSSNAASDQRVLNKCIVQRERIGQKESGRTGRTDAARR
jgi:hypothetical protein